MADIKLALAISDINQGKTVVFDSEDDAKRVFLGFMEDVRPWLLVALNPDDTISVRLDPEYLRTRPNDAIPVLNNRTGEQDLLRFESGTVILEKKGVIPFAELNADWRPWNR